MKIENKEMLLYSAKKAVDAVCRIGGDSVDEKEAYFVVGTAIHWVMDCIERIPRECIKDEHKSIFSALKCANNCLKHNATFKDAHQAEGLDYPYDYAYDYGTYYVWTSIDNVSISASMENQRKNYKSQLEGKNVFFTLSEVLKDIRAYYESF